MPIKIIVCDIEGTTSSISFVKDNLFPYVVKNVQEYLSEKWTEADVQETIKELRDQYIDDLTNNVEGVVPISDGEGKEQAEQIGEVVGNVKWQMENDKKTTSLKKLQGLIWAKGYADGTIKGHVYPDVPTAFERWTTDNIKIYIYSSGSVDAQKLLFGNSEAGDLTSKISGYFDTKTGAKQEKASYAKIVQEIGCDAKEILFLTDIINEAVAAKEIGIQVAILDRPGNGPLTEEDKAKYQVLTSFDDINLEFVSGKRKLDEILTDETNTAKIAKLDTVEAVVSTITDSNVAAETNGIIPTDIISNDTKTEKLVSNGNETDVTMNIEKKTERNDIPECDLSNKNVNLDVDVAEGEDKTKGEKNQIDSKPLIEDEVMKEIDDKVIPAKVVGEKSTETKLIEDVEMKDAPIDAQINVKPKDVEDETSKVIEVSVKPEVIANVPISKSEDVSDASACKSDENKSEEVKPEENKLEDVKPEEKKLEDIKPEEKKPEEKKPEEKKSEEKKPEEKKSEEKKSEEKKSEEKKSEETKSEETKSEETKSEENKLKEIKSGEVQSEQVVDKEKIEITADLVDSKQNGDHTKIDVGNATDEIKVAKLETDAEMEKDGKTNSDDQAATNENGAKDNAVDLNNKENIPVEVVKEKENIIEIPIHIDGDIKSTQKPATNGNGVSASVNDDTDATTHSNKEKMSRIELIIEEKNNDNGQLTQTTTHIVKEITIVKKNLCESAVDTVDKLPENV